LGQEYFVFEIEIDRLIEVMEKKFFHSSLSKFPSVKRDISIVVGDQVSVQNLDDVIKGSAGDQLRNIILFDVYSGERIGQGKKSMAFALEFGADDRTLTDSEVNTLLKRIVDALESKLEAKLRK
jgi:phenylalanyl-tRNA synthetase beta chain